MLHATVGSGVRGAGAGRQGARPPRSQESRRILKYDKGTHDQTQAHRGVIKGIRQSGGGPVSHPRFFISILSLDTAKKTYC
eukprot:scaffold8795_cov116-Isochrysis_galbana.AAC.6